MRGEIIWFSPSEKIGYVIREGTRQAYSAPLMYFFKGNQLDAKLPENPVGVKVEFETIFDSRMDEDVVKSLRLL